MNTDDANQTNPAAINPPLEVTMPTMPTGAGTEVKLEPIAKVGKAEAKLKNKASKSSTPAKSTKAPKAVSNKVQTAKVGKSGKDKGKASKGSIKVPAKTVKSTKVKEPKAAKECKAFPRGSENPYRASSNYGVCFDVLSHLAKGKAAKRSDVLSAYAKAGKRDVKLASYDLAVVLSPAKDGTGHRSSRKDKYYVEKSNGNVQLHMT